MADRITLKWFRIGFLLSTLLVTILIVVPVVGQTAGRGGNPNDSSVAPDGSVQSTRSDGLEPGEVQYGPPPLSNEGETVAVNSLTGSDAPDGHTAGLVIFETRPQSNEAGQVVNLPSTGATDQSAFAAPSGYDSPLVIPAADFRSDGIVPGGYRFWFSGGAIEGTGAGGTCLMAPAYLPNGARITQLWASVYDNDAGYNVSVSLRRVNNYLGTMVVLAQASSSGASTSIQSVTAPSIANPVVEYPTYSYYATVCVSSASVSLYSVRIWYTP